MDFFDAAYRGRPPWDIGRPQKEFVGLGQNGEVIGSVLDIGCGTGENALFFAAEGHEVWGIDSSPAAIQKAQRKAEVRGITVYFLILEMHELSTLNRMFDTVTDSGFFHTLSDEDRLFYAHSLAALLAPGGRYFMLCFSELEPGGYGPRRVTKQEIQDTFSRGWSVLEIRPAVFESNTRAEGSRAWFVSIRRK